MAKDTTNSFVSQTEASEILFGHVHNRAIVRLLEQVGVLKGERGAHFQVLYSREELTALKAKIEENAKALRKEYEQGKRALQIKRRQEQLERAERNSKTVTAYCDNRPNDHQSPTISGIAGLVTDGKHWPETDAYGYPVRRRNKRERGTK